MMFLQNWEIKKCLVKVLFLITILHLISIYPIISNGISGCGYSKNDIEGDISEPRFLIGSEQSIIKKETYAVEDDYDIRFQEGNEFIWEVENVNATKFFEIFGFEPNFEQGERFKMLVHNIDEISLGWDITIEFWDYGTNWENSGYIEGLIVYRNPANYNDSIFIPTPCAQYLQEALASLSGYYTLNLSIFHLTASDIGKEYLIQKQYNEYGIMKTEAYFDTNDEVIVMLKLIEFTEFDLSIHLGDEFIWEIVSLNPNKYYEIFGTEPPFEQGYSIKLKVQNITDYAVGWEITYETWYGENWEDSGNSSSMISRNPEYFSSHYFIPIPSNQYLQEAIPFLSECFLVGSSIYHNNSVILQQWEYNEKGILNSETYYDMDNNVIVRLKLLVEQPSLIPGYDFMLIVSIFCFIFIIILKDRIRKRRKRL